MSEEAAQISVSGPYLRMIATAAAMFLASATLAYADYCADLNARLDAISGPHQISQAADRTQQVAGELQQLRQIAAGQSCRSGFLFGTRGGPDCERILSQVKRLQSELSQLRGQRHASPFNPVAAEQQHILQEMALNSCARMAPDQYAGFETVCVRHCDGYFFQVSFTGSRSQKQQAALCAARYPEGQASLYVRRGGEDAAELVAVDGGKRYADQSFAFRYQQTYDASCPRPLKMASPEEIAEIQKVVDAAGVQSAKLDTVSGIPVPRAKPVASADPELTMHQTGDLSLEAAQQLVAEAEAPKGVRIVGPLAYYTLPPTPIEPPAVPATVAMSELPVAPASLLNPSPMAGPPVHLISQ